MIFAGNFKTNHTRASTKEYIKTLSNLIKDERVYIFPPSIAFDKFEDSSITIGTQNAYPTTNGAFTGEIGLEQLDEFNIKTILIGHSERREILNESQEDIAFKFKFFQENNFEIIYCIGEPLEVRNQGEDKVVEYLLSQFNGIDLNYDNLIVAYEPIWAIGTGVSASIEDITNTHKALKKVVKSPLLYGGSVKVDTIKDISNIDEVDGVLVGSASLDANKFYEMMKI
ncbi:Triosephosphate isomerase [hydrothermal vent metagenome]|uniref:Triosephosphate isomerase n=1 Tax=hydrothermal vent metagenome TaxID=652676 RepID=A0A1W1EHB3_9ZZZZ